MRTSQGYGFTARECSGAAGRLLGAEGALGIYAGSTPGRQRGDQLYAVHRRRGGSLGAQLTRRDGAGRRDAERGTGGSRWYERPGTIPRRLRIVVRARAANGQQTQAIGTMRLGR